MNVSGWLLTQQADGSCSVYHTSGFFIGGFDSKVEAGVWLSAYLLGQYKLQQRAERARLRILAAMPAQGKVS